MALGFNPRGDLSIPMLHPMSYRRRPELDMQRRSIIRLPEINIPKRNPCYDWIFSSGSNVHIAIDRISFKTYTAFKSHVLTVSDQRQVAVHGIGTVELKIRCQPGSRDSHKIVLENVLHVPNWLCNIISDICFSPAREFEHTWTDFGVSFYKVEEGKLKNWGFTENFCGLDRLVLSKRMSGRSPMLEDKEREVFSVNLMWPQAQRDKWAIFLATETTTKTDTIGNEMRARRTKSTHELVSPFDNRGAHSSRVSRGMSLDMERHPRNPLAEICSNMHFMKRGPSIRNSSLKALTGQ